MTEAAELSYILSSRSMSGGPWVLSALNGQGMARQSAQANGTESKLNRYSSNMSAFDMQINVGS